MCYWKFFLGGVGAGEGGWNSINKIGLQVIAEKIKMFSYLHVGKCSHPRDVS